MGLDILYQAIPDDCELLELTRKYQDEWLFRFDFIPPPFILEQYDKVELDFLTAQAKLRENHLGIEKRNFVTRRWDVFLYMLSEQRRRQEKRDDIWERVIMGGDLIIETGRVKYARASEVKEITLLLKETFLERKYFDVNAMIEAKVYKSIQHEQTEAQYKIIESEFEDLRQFYFLAASHNEGIITQMF